MIETFLAVVVLSGISVVLLGEGRHPAVLSGGLFAGETVKH